MSDLFPLGGFQRFWLRVFQISDMEFVGASDVDVFRCLLTCALCSPHPPTPRWRLAAVVCRCVVFIVYAVLIYVLLEYY